MIQPARQIFALVFIAGLASAGACAQTADPGPLTSNFTEILHRLENGHTPSPEEIAAAATQPQPSKDDLHSAVPLIIKALDANDPDVRSYTLTTLFGLEGSPTAPATPGVAAPAPDAAAAAAPAADGTPAATSSATSSPTTMGNAPTGPSTFSSAVASELAPAIPKIAVHLTDDSTQNRILAANILSGFTSNPSSAVYTPLLAYLKRDDAVGPVGQAVVDALLTLGPLSDDVASAIGRYLRRSDQTTDTRSDLIDSIGIHAHQSQSLNKSILAYLDSDDPTVRARLILTLPQLDLAPDVFADTRARISVLAGNDSENLQVVNAARAVTACWNAPHMTMQCPVYQ